MDLYTLSDTTWLAKTPIDEYISAIWTERYTDAGDIQLNLPYTATNLANIKEGTRLALRGSKEIMEISTLNIENSIIKATGTSMLNFLNHRNVWPHNPDIDPDGYVVDFTATDKPGQFISHVVNEFVIDPVEFPGGLSSADLDWEKERIEAISQGAIDATGVSQRLSARVGPMADAIIALAKEHNVGLSLYLDHAEPGTGYELKFKTYQGVDRTSEQDIVPLVKLIPDLDGISDIKEVRSNVLYKNVAYVYYANTTSKHLAEPDLDEPEGFDRRVIIITPTQDEFSAASGSGPARAQLAANAFANANYIHAIDGQTSPVSEYTYGVDYGLGDIIELEGLTGAVSKARITEYIRSDDQTGERAYPTISVV